jgi:NAD(P)-dependent dehydrogenase (short-subunit alcohol dehydrogenase family)
LAGAGFVVHAGVRRAADGEKLAAAATGDLRPLVLDVTDPTTIAAAVKGVEAAVGDAGLYALFNNAGVSGGVPLEFSTDEEWRQMLGVNVVGQVAMTRAFLPLLRAARGRIVFTGSIGGRTPVPFTAAYSASKAAISAIVDCLRIELRPWGMQAVLLEPGSIATEIWRKGLEEFDERQRGLPAEAEALYGAVIPKLRTITEKVAAAGIAPDRVAEVVESALTARRPRTRYIVGSDARAQAAIRRLPDRARDGLIARYIGLPDPED